MRLTNFEIPVSDNQKAFYQPKIMSRNLISYRTYFNWMDEIQNGSISKNHDF